MSFISKTALVVVSSAATMVVATYVARRHFKAVNETAIAALREKLRVADQSLALGSHRACEMADVLVKGTSASAAEVRNAVIIAENVLEGNFYAPSMEVFAHQAPVPNAGVADELSSVIKKKPTIVPLGTDPRVNLLKVEWCGVVRKAIPAIPEDFFVRHDPAMDIIVKEIISRNITSKDIDFRQSMRALRFLGSKSTEVRAMYTELDRLVNVA